MGVVYRARHVRLDRIVAVKMIRAGDFADAEDVARFIAEAQVVASLQHPSIVQLYEIGEHEGRPYFSLEYVAGGTLADAVRGVPQPAQVAAEFVEVLARAVDTAHRAGVIHRDLKPSNILLSEQRHADEQRSAQVAAGDTVDRPALALAPRAKVADFGLAKRLHQGAGRTRTGAVVGTPSYMAPEQAAGKTKEVGPAVDIYSLGAILYELLTGRPPFRGESPEATRDLVMSQEPVAPRRLQPKLPRDLETICLKCLDKNPQKRYGSALALAEELRRYLDGQPIQARPIGQIGRAWRWARRKPALAGLATLATLTVIAGIALVVGFWLFRSYLSREERVKRATHALDQGLALCAAGDSGQGLLWLARALDLAPDDAADLQRVARANLGAWQNEINSLKIILAQEDEVRFIASSPDGKVLLTASLNETCLWTSEGARAGTRIARLLPHAGDVLAARFSADGKTLLTRNRTCMQRWDATNGQALGPPEETPYLVASAVFSSDGQWVLTASRKGIAQLWNADTGRPLGKTLEHVGVTLVALSRDGKLALTGSDGEAYLWDLAAGTRRGEPFRHDGLRALVFGPDDTTVLTAGADKMARLWDVSGKFIRPFEHPQALTAAAFAPDGATILTGSEDGSARVWITASGKQLGTMMVHAGPINSVAFGPGKTVLTGSADKSTRVWQLKTPVRPRLVFQHTRPVVRVAYSPDGRTLLSAGQDGAARLWATANDKPERKLQHKVPVDAIFSPSGDQVLTGSANIVRLWDARTDKQIAGFSHEGELIVNGERREVAVLTFAFAPDGRTIVTGSSNLKGDLEADGALAGRADLVRPDPVRPDPARPGPSCAALWDALSGKLIRILPHPGAVNAAAFSPDGQTLLTAGQNEGRLWDVATGRLRARLSHNASVFRAIFSADGSLALTADARGTAQVWNAATGQRLSHAQFEGGIYAAAFSGDGKVVFSAGQDKFAHAWDTRTGGARASFPHRGRVRSLALSPDEQILLTGSDDRTARLWDAATGKPIGPAWPHGDRVRSVAFAPDGKTALTGSYDNKARLWEIALPLDVDRTTLTLWTSVITGMELDDTDRARVLDANTWHARSADLQRLG